MTNPFAIFWFFWFFYIYWKNRKFLLNYSINKKIRGYLWKNIECGSGSVCVATNNIERPDVPNHLFFSGTSGAGGGYPLAKIVAVRAQLLVKKGGVVVDAADSYKVSGKYAYAGTIYGNAKKGVTYRNELTHFFYKQDGSAYIGSTTSSIFY